MIVCCSCPTQEESLEELIEMTCEPMLFARVTVYLPAELVATFELKVKANEFDELKTYLFSYRNKDIILHATTWRVCKVCVKSKPK